MTASLMEDFQGFPPFRRNYAYGSSIACILRYVNKWVWLTQTINDNNMKMVKPCVMCGVDIYVDIT